MSRPLASAIEDAAPIATLAESPIAAIRDAAMDLIVSGQQHDDLLSVPVNEKQGQDNDNNDDSFLTPL
jgi:hypothetical protein